MRLFTTLLFFLCSMAQAQNVQWASSVLEFSSEKSSKQYSAKQVMGKPASMPPGGDSPTAWRPAQISGNEFVKVGFSVPGKIQQVIIAESFAASAVSKVFLYDASGKEHSVYRGKPGKVDGGVRMLSVLFPKTTYDVMAVKVVLDLTKYGKFVLIDAIGISDSKDPFVAKPNIATDMKVVSEKENLGENINSTYDELLPVISADGKTLYICRVGDPSGEGDQDIRISELMTDGKWGKAINPGQPLNNKDPNFVSSVTTDGNKVILGGSYNKGGQGISYSTKNKSGGWDEPLKLPVRDYYNLNDYNEFCMGGNGKVLLMTVERKDSYGDKDIYVSFLEENAEWSEPKNIGGVVNTAGGETGPFLASDNTTLYFSSAGHPGYGSNDIFMTKRLDSTWTNWSEPVNLGPVINTPDWDAYYTLPASGEYAYFSSSKRAIGGIDIFRVKLPKEIKPDPVVLVSGKVLNAKTKEPIACNITYVFIDDGKEAGIASSGAADGTYKISLLIGKKYGFSASMEGFIAVNENMDLLALSEYTEIKRDLYLVPIEVGQTVRLNNVFFETGKWDLLKDSFLELDKLAQALIENPVMEIEIEGHTDDLGSETSNLSLSKNRAKAVLDHLISKGINATRLRSNGYGETKPLADNKTDEGRAMNRRVQFTISKK